MSRRKHDHVLTQDQLSDIVSGRLMEAVCQHCNRTTKHFTTILLDEENITFLTWDCVGCSHYNYYLRIGVFMPN